MAHIDHEPPLNTYPSVRHSRPFVLPLKPAFSPPSRHPSIKHTLTPCKTSRPSLWPGFLIFVEKPFLYKGFYEAVGGFLLPGWLEFKYTHEIIRCKQQQHTGECTSEYPLASGKCHLQSLKLKTHQEFSCLHPLAGMPGVPSVEPACCEWSKASVVGILAFAS